MLAARVQCSALELHADPPRHGLWLVLERDSGQPVGQVGLTLQQVDGVAEPEVGYLIKRACWRRGFASEAAAATRDAVDGVARPVHAVSSPIRNAADTTSRRRS